MIYLLLVIMWVQPFENVVWILELILIITIIEKFHIFLMISFWVGSTDKKTNNFKEVPYL